MNTAPRDANQIPALLGTSSSDGTTVTIYANPVTHRLLVDSGGSGSTLVVTDGITTVTGVTTLDFTSGATVTDGGGGTADVAITGGGGGSPGGSNLQVQYNNSGAFGGVSGVTSNGTSMQFASSDLLLSGSSSGGVTLNAPATGGGVLTLPPGTDTIAGLAASQALTNKSVNGVTLTTGGSTSTFLNANGVYSTPAGAGTVTTVSVVTANGISGSVANPTTTPAITLTLGAITPSSINVSGLTASSAVATDASKNLVSVINTGTGNNVLAASPALTGTPTAPTASAGDNSTQIATDAFVTTAIANAIAGVNPATSVSYATTTTGNTSGLTYNNGVSGVGATFTGASNTAVTIDGHTFVVGDVGITRLLVKNDTQSPSGAFNGIYLFTALQTVGTGAIFTRALDYDTPNNINNTGAIPVLSGTANALTSWLLNTTVVTMGTTPITYTQFSFNPTGIVPPNLGGTGIANNASSTVTISGSFGTTLTVSGTTALTLPTSGTVTAQGNTVTGTGSIVLATSPTLVTPTLGVATATSINGNIFTTGSSTYTGTAAAVYTFPGSSATIAGLATTQTFSNKRITRRITTVNAPGATPTTNSDNDDVASFTGLAANITSMTTNLSGTPNDCDFLEFKLIDNGTPRTISWGASFGASTVALPTTTVANTVLRVLFEWSAALTLWVCVAVA